MNQNLETLASLLDKHLIKSGDPASCGIVFVKTRAMTIGLCSWLQRHRVEALRDLKAEPFTGSGASADEGGVFCFLQFMFLSIVFFSVFFLPESLTIFSMSAKKNKKMLL